MGRDELLERLQALVGERDTILVADEITADLLPLPGTPLRIPSGEAGKSAGSWQRVLELALDRRLDRGGFFLGLGGGVVCDLTAFSASTYLRGVDVVLVPTTLLAMVDAALGGKTGINLGGYKNMVGTFYPASEILIHTGFLSTLPEREFVSGLAEVVKSAMLGDPDLFGSMEADPQAYRGRSEEAMADAVRRSLRVKADHVEADLTETGIRAHLNLGHTFGHALESVTGFARYTHGEAVAWGIRCAIDLGVLMGITSPDYALRVERLLDAYGFPAWARGVGVDELIAAMGQDKKRRDGRVRFVLQEDLGKTVIREAPQDALKATLAPRLQA